MRGVVALASMLLLGPSVVAETPPVTLVVDEAALPMLEGALAPGVGVAVVPRKASVAVIDRLEALLRAERLLVLRPPIDERLPERVRIARRGSGRCGVVVRAEEGITFADVAVLERLGPCAYDVFLSSAPTVLRPRLARLRPATFTWVSDAAAWDDTELVRFAGLPGAVLSVRDVVAPLALAQLERLDLGIALEIRLEGSVLATGLAERIAAAKVPVRVVVRELDRPLARALRVLPLSAIRVEPVTVTPSLLEGLTAVTRLVDPPRERRPSEAELDAPLIGR